LHAHLILRAADAGGGAGCPFLAGKPQLLLALLVELKRLWDKQRALSLDALFVSLRWEQDLAGTRWQQTGCKRCPARNKSRSRAGVEWHARAAEKASRRT